jgi:hypothetical protein
MIEVVADQAPLATCSRGRNIWKNMHNEWMACRAPRTCNNGRLAPSLHQLFSLTHPRLSGETPLHEDTKCPKGETIPQKGSRCACGTQVSTWAFTEEAGEAWLEDKSAYQAGEEEYGEEHRDIRANVEAQCFEAGQVQEHSAAQPSYVQGVEVDVTPARAHLPISR